MGTLLLYHMEEQAVQKVRSALALTGITVLSVQPEQELIPIGKLAPQDVKRTGGQMPGRSPLPVPIAAAIREPMAVICVENEARFDQLLAVMRTAAPKGILKAVLTPVNQVWNGRQLYGELCAERSAVERKRSTKI